MLVLVLTLKVCRLLVKEGLWRLLNLHIFRALLKNHYTKSSVNKYLFDVNLKKFPFLVTCTMKLALSENLTNPNLVTTKFVWQGFSPEPKVDKKDLDDMNRGRVDKKKS